MVQEIYRKRIKYALECSYELQANLEILKEEIIQDTAALHTIPGPKTTRYGPDSENGGGSKASLEESFCLRQEELERNPVELENIWLYGVIFYLFLLDNTAKKLYNKIIERR